MSKSLSISICVPAYSMNGHGAAFLKHSLDVLSKQEFRDFEVLIADQSDDDDIQKLCSEFPDLNLNYLRTGHLKRQASANTNAAIDAAQGDIIKILFQDDFLIGPQALTKVAEVFQDQSVSWCLTGSEHSRDGKTLIRPFVPLFHNRIHFGKNTISSPSVLSFRKLDAPRFDESLIWLMDVDFYKRCALQWGPPTILSDPLVVNRLHDGQVSAGVSKALIRAELRYVRKKFSGGMSVRDWLHYFGRLRKTWI